MLQQSSQTPFVEETIFCPNCQRGTISYSQRRCSSCGHTVSTDGRILVIDKTPTTDYPAEGAGVQQEVADSHFWFCARTALIQSAVRRRLGTGEERRFVELGCSNGYVLAAIESLGVHVTGVDMHIDGLRSAQSRVQGSLICGRIEQIHFHTPVDGIGLFDVIEHVENDADILRQSVRQLRPGGVLFVTVPALMSLWSRFDELLGHKRRYTRRELVSLLRSVGLNAVEVRYAFSFAVPLVWIQRRVLQRGVSATTSSLHEFMQPPSPFVNRVLSFFARCEAVCREQFRIPIPLGTSLIGIAQRPT